MIDFETQIAVWTVKQAELEAEAKALREAGQHARATDTEVQVATVADHLYMLRELRDDRERQAALRASWFY